MSLKIVADSTCDLPQELIEQYAITILPLHITMGDGTYLDGKEIQPKDIIAMMIRKVISAQHLPSIFRSFRTVFKA